jgi:hypothetical protein
LTEVVRQVQNHVIETIPVEDATFANMILPLADAEIALLQQATS